MKFATHELHFRTLNIGDIHIVGRWAEFFQLLSGEDIKGNKMDLGVTVLSSFGGGHVNDLAGAAFDYNEAVLAESRTLHRIGGRGTSIGAVEGMLMLYDETD